MAYVYAKSIQDFHVQLNLATFVYFGTPYERFMFPFSNLIVSKDEINLPRSSLQCRTFSDVHERDQLLHSHLGMALHSNNSVS